MSVLCSKYALLDVITHFNLSRTLTLSDHSIRQKSGTVFGKGPCDAT